jgi:YD repeat-containing protein
VGTADEATVSYEYNLAGNQTAVIDENGHRTDITYDSHDRLTKIIEADPDGVGIEASPVTTYKYDKKGNLIETIDALNHATQHTYDKLDRRISTINAEQKVTEFTYYRV